MIPGAAPLRRDYKDLTLPVVIVAGDGDKVVFKRRSEQLRDSIPDSELQIVKGAGHMVSGSFGSPPPNRLDRREPMFGEVFEAFDHFVSEAPDHG
jgi:alpha-beta hydrolase superfamily lysophospholipase